MSFQEDVEGALRTLEPKFDCKGLALPRISNIVTPCTKYDPHSASMFEGTYHPKGCPDHIKVYFLGKAVSSYIHHTINSDLLRIVVDRGNAKFAEAKKHGFEKEWRERKQPEYMLLMQLFALMATYGGLVFSDVRHGRVNVSRVVDDITFQFSKQAVEDLLSPRKEPTPFGSLEATRWYTKGHQWLPKVARVKSKSEYEGLVQQSGIDSVLL